MGSSLYLFCFIGLGGVGTCSPPLESSGTAIVASRDEQTDLTRYFRFQ